MILFYNLYSIILKFLLHTYLVIYNKAKIIYNIYVLVLTTYIFIYYIMYNCIKKIIAKQFNLKIL